LENGKVDGILEEMFTAIEFVKEKADSGLSVAQVLEEKHGYGAAIKRDGFSHGVWGCLPKLMAFVSYEIYSNTSKLLKSVKVRVATVTVTAAAVSSDAAAATTSHCCYCHFSQRCCCLTTAFRTELASVIILHITEFMEYDTNKQRSILSVYFVRSEILARLGSRPFYPLFVHC